MGVAGTDIVIFCVQKKATPKCKFELTMT